MSDSGPATSDGLRARKRRETLQRITDAGISLFIEKGLSATTLDDIAVRAGISRRTFFYYFKSKDEILLSLQTSLGGMLAEAVRRAPRSKRPLHVVRDAMMAVCTSIPTHDMIAIDRLMRSSEAVQARKQAAYIQNERAVLAALREIWPEPERETGLKLVAMLSVGALRLATDVFNRDEGKRPLVEILNETFDAVETGL